MDLYIVRHAIAFERDSERWPNDSERPLTPAGERKFRRCASALGRLVGRVDVVLASPFVRAWQTAQILEEEAGWPAPTACEALEVGNTPGDVVRALLPHQARDSVALVGHEPSLHEVTSHLLLGGGKTPFFEFKKGGVAKLRVEDKLGPGSASLLWLLTPRVLRAGSD